MEKGAVPCGSLLEEVDMRVCAEKCADWGPGTYNMLRNRWPMERVIEMFHGEDGEVRSARVKTAGDVFQRPVTKICLLEEVKNDERSLTVELNRH